MSGEILVTAENVSKKFCRNLKKSLWYGMQDVVKELNPLGRRKAFSMDEELPLRSGEFWANHNISFELRRGECLGLIGRNGAGKTTLLKMLNGLIKPDSGQITMRGRVGALIALGAGFNPILTGRENIYVNGSILGLTKKEIGEKLDSIVDFAEIDDFIDAPVQSYSSGMQVRLGFAVATALDPDILILDEVLAVGDASFRNKCYRRIAELRKSAAILFVTHQMSHIARMCDNTLVLKGGRTAFLGGVEEGVHHYEQYNEENISKKTGFMTVNEPIKSFSFSIKTDHLLQGGALDLEMQVDSEKNVDFFTLRIVAYSIAGDICMGSDSLNKDYQLNIEKGLNRWKICIPNISLKRGKYFISIGVMSSDGTLIVWSFKESSFEVEAKKHGPSVDYQPIVSCWKKITNRDHSK